MNRCCHCCPCPPCPCQLEPVVLFKVDRRAFEMKYPAWHELGYTIDLSEALRVKDSPRGGSITVHRGFRDKGGLLYNTNRAPVRSLCVG